MTQAFSIQPPEEEKSVTGLFFNLLQCGIGKRSCLPSIPNDTEWDRLFDIATKQTLLGITFAGIKQIPQEQRPYKKLLLIWHKACEEIKEQNRLLNKQSIAVSEKFRQLGFNNCILKGQGIARLYPDPTLRTPGDIDIWLEGGADRILDYVRKCFPRCKPTYHHVDFPIKKGVEIEIHFTPSWMYSPTGNRSLQRYFATTASAQFNNSATTPEGIFTAPTQSFNSIYILLHIYRHLFQEGIGLRQLLDYHFVLDKGLTPAEKAEYTKTLKALGLTRFAAATMYVLKEQFGLEDEKMPVKPDPKRGKFLLNEIMLAGNFGKYDSRYAIVAKENELRHFLNSIRRTTRLIAQYPGETLWSPYFKIWHYFWRKRHQ